MNRIAVDPGTELPDEELTCPSEDPSEVSDEPSGDDLEDSDVEEDDDDRAGVL